MVEGISFMSFSSRVLQLEENAVVWCAALVPLQRPAGSLFAGRSRISV